ncbi:hypothetical protein D3C71_259000 [compost metagenome]
MICGCGQRMVGNGIRTQRITDWRGDTFVSAAAEVRRFRCGACGSTERLVSPDTESGFRMSRIAADRIIDRVIDKGITRSAADANLDSATVSRLVSSRTNAVLHDTERPRMARLDMVDGNMLCVSDIRTKEPVAVFAGCRDDRLVPWLSRPYPSVIVPDAFCAPQLLKLSATFKMAMSAQTVLDLVRPLLSRAAGKLPDITDTPHEVAANVSQVLGGADPIRQATTASVTSAGTPARHFMRLCGQLFDALSSRDADVGQNSVKLWRSACTGAWERVFASVIHFLDAFAALVFSHPVCLEPRFPAPKFELSTPANVLSLSLDRMRRLAPVTGLRPAGPRYALISH